MRKILDEELYKVVAHLNSPTIRELQTHWKNEFGRGIISSRAAEFRRKYFSSISHQRVSQSDISQRVFDLSKFDEQQISVFEKEIEENNKKISLLQNRNKEIRFELSILKMKYSYEKRIYELEEENRALKDEMINRGSDKEEGELIISDDSLPLFLDESISEAESILEAEVEAESVLETSVIETEVKAEVEAESVLETSVIETETEVKAEVEVETEVETEVESVLVVPGTAKEFRKFLKDFKELEVKYLKTYDSIEKIKNEIDSSFVGWYIRFSEDELFKFVGKDVSTAFEYLSNYLKK